MSKRYSLSGTYFEGCRCASPCPCGNHCPTSRCDVAVGWHIDRGSVGATDLSGLNVIGVYNTPDDFANGELNASLYLDQRADHEQQQALREIFTGQRGGQMARMRQFMGDFHEVRTAPIEFNSAGGRGTLRVPGVIEGELEHVQNDMVF